MIITFTRTFLLGLIVLLAGCTSKPAVYHEQLLVFGTVVYIQLWGVKQAQGQRVVTQLAKDFDYMHRSWHAWHGGGTLARTNGLLATGKVFSAGPSVLPLIRRGTELSQRSVGLFNPAIGKIVALWGFASDDPPKGPATVG